MIIQRTDKADGDAVGLDYLWLWSYGGSPIWSTRERAADFPNAEQVAAEITDRYGYRLILGSNVDEERQSILARMKSGELPKAEAIAMLKAHADARRLCA